MDTVVAAGRAVGTFVVEMSVVVETSDEQTAVVVGMVAVAETAVVAGMLAVAEMVAVAAILAVAEMVAVAAILAVAETAVAGMPAAGRHDQLPADSYYSDPNNRPAVV